MSMNGDRLRRLHGGAPSGGPPPRPQEQETDMAKLRVHNIAVSLDGYAAGPDQGIDDPLGVGGTRLHEWVFASDYGKRFGGGDAGTAPAGEPSLDDRVLARGDENIGATIMGRNMFGPVRGSWGDEHWRGWWGPEPPYHHEVFVLTHHAHEPIPMAGGTTFHFVTEGPEAALEQAFAAAGGADVRIGGGPATIQQYMRAGLVDEINVAVVPILLGAGERLFANLDGVVDLYECAELACSDSVAHVLLTRKDG
jgi:dihydrofolate reductase